MHLMLVCSLLATCQNSETNTVKQIKTIKMCSGSSGGTRTECLRGFLVLEGWWVSTSEFRVWISTNMMWRYCSKRKNSHFLTKRSIHFSRNQWSLSPVKKKLLKKLLVMVTLLMFQEILIQFNTCSSSVPLAQYSAEELELVYKKKGHTKYEEWPTR